MCNNWTNKNLIVSMHGATIKIYYCSTSFGAESFVFQGAIQKFKDQDI